MIAAIVAAVLKVLHEIWKAESGPIVASVEGSVPAELRGRWADWVRERAARGAD